MTDRSKLEDQIGELNAQIRQLVKAEQRSFSYQLELDRQLELVHAVNDFALEAGALREPREVLDLALTMLMHQINLHEAIGLIADDHGRLHITSARTHHPYPSSAFEAIEPLVIESCPRRPVLASDPGPSEIDNGTRTLDRSGGTPTGAPTTDEARAERAASIYDSSQVSAVASAHCLATVSTLFDEVFGPAHQPVHIILPLRARQESRVVGLLVGRHRTPHEGTYVNPPPASSDLPFLALMANHLESILDNALLAQRLELLNRELEARVSERTAALSNVNDELAESLAELQQTQGQLFQAGKMAAVGTLVAGLSHELNTPLGIILGYTQSLLRDGTHDKDTDLALNAIERQTHRCTNLVSSLLDFSRYDPQTRIPQEPEILVRSAVELVTARVKLANVTLRVSLPPEPMPLVDANQTEVESALINLLNNAIDAVGDGGQVEIRSRATVIDQALAVEFEVEDNGPGIPEEVEPWIFDPFFTTKPEGEGTGLGLSLTRRIIEAHEGNIEVRPGDNGGTVIRAWIPTPIRSL